MFKTKNIYSLKERFTKDINKSPKWGWLAILTIWIIITAMIVMAEPSKALNDYPITEDYSMSLPDYPMEFGKILINDTVNLNGDYTTDQKNAVILAWKISHDKNFLYMLAAENGQFSPDRKGDRGKSIGYCQIHSGYHPEITSNKQFYNPVWQMQKCYDMWKGGVRFYGYDRFKNNPAFRSIIKNQFTFYE